MDETNGDLQLVASGVVSAPSTADTGARTHSSTDSMARGRLLGLLTLQAAAFALAGASGKMPAVVILLFRALLIF